ncbi:MAG TPA: DUF4932 domain-containing protein, partial [Paludibacter sp.]|nr:DUF4932 domain-containing protein [Paludibacter sp.]
WDGFNNLFRELLPFTEDFALKSNFHKFYTSHKEYYSKQTARLNQLLPVKKIWKWLEAEFPKRKCNSYKIIFSPLIGGSHSTQIFFTRNPKTNNEFCEIVMFICSAYRYDMDDKLTEKQKEGLMSGVVFTEIDHNYVNPETSRYRDEVSKVFTKQNSWSSPNENWYNDPISVFNEYMTHSLYCLWIKENYDEKTADFIINMREDLNVNKRGFYKFNGFNRELMRLHKENPKAKVSDLYPLILKWCKEHCS